MAKTEARHNVKTGIFSGIYKLHSWQVSSADLEYSLASSMRIGWKLNEEIAMIKMTVMIGTDMAMDIIAAMTVVSSPAMSNAERLSASTTTVRTVEADYRRRAERNELGL